MTVAVAFPEFSPQQNARILENLEARVEFYRRLATQDPRSGLVAYAQRRLPVLEGKVNERRTA